MTPVTTTEPRELPTESPRRNFAGGVAFRCEICRIPTVDPIAANPETVTLCPSCRKDELDEARESAAEARRLPIQPDPFERRPFGAGAGEIPSSAIVSELARTRSESRHGLPVAILAAACFLATSVAIGAGIFIRATA